MRKADGREVVIVEAVRTPIGRGHPQKGYYRDTHPNALLAKTYTEVIERAGIDAAEVEDVIAGCVQQVGEQGFNVGRNAWLQAGLPVETPATTVDRQCGSAQQAVNFGAALIAAGVHDVVDRLRRRAHGPHPDGRELQVGRGGRLALARGAARPLQPRAAGDLGRDDRRSMGDPTLRAGRARPALAAAGPAGDRGGPLRARDRADRRQRRHLRHRPGPPPGHEPRGAWPSSSRRSGRTGASPPATRPRSPTAPPRCC